jgi:hypothetical protein
VITVAKFDPPPAPFESAALVPSQSSSASSSYPSLPGPAFRNRRAREHVDVLIESSERHPLTERLALRATESDRFGLIVASFVLEQENERERESDSRARDLGAAAKSLWKEEGMRCCSCRLGSYERTIERSNGSSVQGKPGPLRRRRALLLVVVGAIGHERAGGRAKERRALLRGVSK